MWRFSRGCIGATPVARAAELLARARAHYDRPEHELAALATNRGWRGFRGGAEWMRAALATLRGVAPEGRATFEWLGFVKYAIAGSTASIVAAGAIAMIVGSGDVGIWCSFGWASLLLVVPVFYVVESRMVFAFPAALDGAARPFATSTRIVRNAGSMAATTAVVMRIAVEMLLGGVRGRGFVRSWCVGCLAVVMWYEDVRSRSPGPGSAS